MKNDGLFAVFVFVLVVILAGFSAATAMRKTQRNEYVRCRSWQRIAPDSTVVTLHPECYFWLNPLPVEKP